MVILNNIREDLMPTFMMSLNWTDQGIRAVKDSPKRSEAARELAKKVGVEIKHLYLTSGDSDLVIFVDAPSGDNVAKFALAVSSLGNVGTRTVPAWAPEEDRKPLSAPRRGGVAARGARAGVAEWTAAQQLTCAVSSRR